MENQVLAKVGPLTVTLDEVEEFIAGLGQRGQAYNTPEGRKIILEQLIGNKLLLLDAKRNLLETEPEFKAQLARVKEELLISYATNKAIESVRVTEKEARDYYDSNPEQFIGEETVNASHILVATEEEAVEILAKINRGEITFEAAAQEYSTCPSGQRGGNLGDFGKGQMVPEFDRAVFAMEVGEMTSAPVQTQFGFHLIKLNSKKPAETTPYEAICEQLKEMLVSQKRRDAYQSKVNQLKILYPIDLI